MTVRNYEIEVNALRHIHRHGWLRASELGLMLFKQHTKKYASRLVAKLKADKCVLERQLPDGLGKALVLAKNGVMRLKENGIEAKSGKDWGTLSDNKFTPPRLYKHDLLVSAVLANLYQKGYRHITERTVLEQPTANLLFKVPDAILQLPDNSYGWLEVESARKSGKSYVRKGYLKQAGHFQKLIDALIKAALGTTVLGLPITSAFVAYDINAKDELGYAINHRARIEKALREQAVIDFEIKFVGVERSGGTVIDMQIETVKIAPNSPVEWQWDGQGDIAQVGKHRVTVWCNYDYCQKENKDVQVWAYRVDDRPCYVDYIKTEAAAKRAGVIAALAL